MCTVAQEQVADTLLKEVCTPRADLQMADAGLLHFSAGNATADPYPSNELREPDWHLLLDSELMPLRVDVRRRYQSFTFLCNPLIRRIIQPTMCASVLSRLPIDMAASTACEAQMLT